MKKVIAAVVIIMLGCTIAGYNVMMRYLNEPLAAITAQEIVLVETGASLKLVARRLEKSGMMAHPDWLVFYARLHGHAQIKAGEYQFAAGITPLQLLKDLNEGKIIHHQVTIVDGHTFRDALETLHSEEKLQKKLKGLSAAAIAKRLKLDRNNPEGLVYPDTYQYTLGMSDQDILEQAAKKMQEVLQEEWEQRDGDLPYQNAYEALIMASIVEKETGAAEERPEIAGVFVRRLQKGMKLQTDPTVIYGLSDSFNGNLTRKHLLTDGPYNTYTRSGLPPTPIALPGREAIHAALHPAPGNALYFVGMGDGHHYFSTTLAEHEQAVKKYQLIRKKDYHSAPTASGKRGG